MKITSLKVQGFRAFGEKAEFDLSADVVVLQGPNGAGKTSLFDAVLWALTGTIDRFRDRGSPVSVYSPEGRARVELSILADSDPVSIVRATDGITTNLQLSQAGRELEGTEAEVALSSLLLPQLQDRSTVSSALTRVLTRGVYLQQDLVRQFIETDLPTDRFALISEVIGSGIVSDLQASLEKSRSAWSRFTTSMRNDQLSPLLQQQERAEIELKRLYDSSVSADVRPSAERLFQRALEVMGPTRLSLTEAPQGSASLDRLLKEISAEIARIDREIANLETLRADVTDLVGRTSGSTRDVAELVAAEEKLNEDMRSIEGEIQDEIASIGRERARLLEAQSKVAKLGTMAEIALGELGDRCPVCGQTYDTHATTEHLQELIRTALTATKQPIAVDESKISHLTARQTELRGVYERSRGLRIAAQDQAREVAARTKSIEARAGALGAPAGAELSVWLSQEIERRTATRQNATRLLTEGESIALSVVRLGEQRRRTELQAQVVATETQIAALSADIESRERTHKKAGEIIDALRTANLSITKRQIERIEPILQRIYSRIDPHPTFRTTQLVAALERGKGALQAGVSDPDQDAVLRDAIPILSSSQLNSFAVSLFLAINLGLPSLRLGIVMLDDPLQSLDSINLLGLVDVLRRFRVHRQIFVSTHEPRLLSLLQRKLRPIRENERMITVTFSDWTRKGPSFVQNSLEFNASEPRVLAA